MEYFWKKKTIISYILACFILLIHNSAITRYGVDISVGGIETFNAIFSTFFNNTFARLAVPLFFIISGCLFFRNCDNIKDVLKKMKSRVFTLLIPFLLWNILNVIYQILTSNAFFSQFYNTRTLYEISLNNIFWSIFYARHNVPFWFIFALIVFVIISPIIFYLLKNKFFALIFLLALLILHQFDIIFAFPNFFRSDSIIFYYLGCIIGKYYFDLFYKKLDSNKALIFLFIFIICLVIDVLYVFNSSLIKLITIIDTIFFMIFALSFWYLCDLFIEKIKYKEFYNQSFYVYAMHHNIQTSLKTLIWFILPKNDYFCIVNYFLNFIVTLLIINYICIFLKKYLPKIYQILGGGRG